MSPGETSPRLRRVLTAGFESRHSTALFQEPAAGQPAAAPRTLRKAGVRDFTDATNPFARSVSKQMTRADEARGDRERAGAPTRSPRVQAALQSAYDCPKTQGEDGRHLLVPYRYGGHESRPAKKPAPPESASWPAVASDAGKALGGWRACGGALENYLNDMKRTKQARAVPQAAPPSPWLQRMTDMRLRLPAEREPSRARSLSCEPATEDFWAGAQRRSASQSPGDEEHREKYGFTRKRVVGGTWTHHAGRLDLLHHPGGDGLAGDVTPRTPNSTRATQAGERFDEVMEHAKAFGPEQRQSFEYVKTKSECTAGLLASEQTVLHPPSERRPKLGAVTPRSWLSAASSPRSPASVAPWDLAEPPPPPPAVTTRPPFGLS